MTANDELRQLVTSHELSPDQVAAFVGKSADAVKSWLKPATSKSHRRMHANDLRLLKLELANHEIIQ